MVRAEQSAGASEEESSGDGFPLTWDYFSQAWAMLSVGFAGISLVSAELFHAMKTKMTRNYYVGKTTLSGLR